MLLSHLVYSSLGYWDSKSCKHRGRGQEGQGSSTTPKTSKEWRQLRGAKATRTTKSNTGTKWNGKREQLFTELLFELLGLLQLWLQLNELLQLLRLHHKLFELLELFLRLGDGVEGREGRPLGKMPGGNCMKISLPGKSILRKRKGIREVIFS